MMSVMMLLYCLHTVVIVPLLAVRYLFAVNNVVAGV